jgi:group I intron endonuclease
MLIYKATNKINGMSYIGQTTKTLDDRKRQHIIDALAKRDRYYFHSALRKYGQENFDWDIIDECDNIDELNRLEIFYIGHYKTYFEGYNLTMGGEGMSGYKFSEETRQKMSESLKGKHTDEKNYFYGKHFTGKDNHNAKSIILIHPDGLEERFDCMMDAARKYDLFQSTLSLVAQGKQKQYKGFRCKYLN